MKKLLLNGGYSNAGAATSNKSEFFWFFLFTKRTAFFACLSFLPLPALAYDNAACWRYAEQQGPRPDITCTPITSAFLDSLQNAPQSQIAAEMNEPGESYPDGTLHYTGNDLNDDGGYQGTIVLTFSAGYATAIDARLNNPNQGGSYFTYRWTQGGQVCSNLPGSQEQHC